ncbi:hypothetical protein ACX8Z9_15835 [Arthrobacter halodurans]|uniref:Lipoprotein n=1 Tax=Arthrobacter halodurans TaxID=516699 RepID=A0ABV4USG9_9MICC
MEIPRAIPASGAVALAVLLGGCGADSPPRECPEIALMEGFTLVVEADSVPDIPPESVALQVCQENMCRESEVRLSPGSASVDLGCSGTAPDAACSASASRDGSLVGSWPTDDFFPGPLTATVSGEAFGPFSADLAGVERTSGAGACAHTAFQTALRVGGGKLSADDAADG